MTRSEIGRQPLSSKTSMVPSDGDIDAHVQEQISVAAAPLAAELPEAIHEFSKMSRGFGPGASQHLANSRNCLQSSDE